MLSTTFLGTKLKNPLILASGVLGVTRSSLEDVCTHGAGAVITKSLSLEPRTGHNTPIMVQTEHGFLNAVGYTNPGIEEGIKEFSGWNKKEGLILSIVGKDAGEFAQLAKKVNSAVSSGTLSIAAIEAVLSCPHTPGYGTMAGQGTPAATREITEKIVKETDIPLIIKLSPSSEGVGGLAKAAEESGAQAIDMGNTLGPGMVIDTERGKPVLSFKFGGLSGPAMKPIAIRCVYDVYQSVDIPILGCGGVTTGTDAIEMIMAGASVLGVGTACYYRGKGAFKEIAKEMEQWLKTHSYASFEDLIGMAHE